MQRQTLASAFSAALKTAQTPSRPPRPDCNGVPSPSLLNALKNSTTRMDQIIQRRIGAQTESGEVSQESRRAGNPPPSGD